MSTITAIGPAFVLDGPLPQPPAHSLLSVPGVLAEGGGRWLNGVNVHGYPSDVPSLWDPCSTGTFRPKNEVSNQPQPRFDAFGMYLPIVCSTLGMGDWDEFKARAQAVLEATESFAVEQALSQGDAVASNPFLGDASVNVLGGGPVTPLVGLSYLEQAIGESGRAGLIHSPPEVVAAWGFERLREERGTLYTTTGCPVACGGGYIGATANGAAAGAGNSWVFASGPVQVRLSEVSLVGDELNGVLDTAINEVVLRAERYALALWDTALQVAVEVDWT